MPLCCIEETLGVRRPYIQTLSPAFTSAVTFCIPTFINRFRNKIAVRGRDDMSDKENRDIVFDGDQFGVVDTRLRCNLLSLLHDLDSYGGKAKLGFALETPSFAAILTNYAMLVGFHALLTATLTPISEDWSAVD